MSPVCARCTRLCTAASWMERARMCASGRKCSVRVCSLNTSSRTPSAAQTLCTSASRFAWLIAQPLGRPVVPEV